jgi:tetratricopeptide (TPR) repeat protein
VTARVLLAEFYQQQGDRKSAIRHYEAALQTAFSPAVMNNLAWLYYETGDSRALDLARRAYDAQPDRYEIADTYGWILVESGRVADGLPVLEKAARAAPDQPDIQYHLAAARARAGRKEEALRSLESLLDQAPAFASRADAEKLLKSLRGG